MSSSWGRQLGTLIGGTLAGPCGAIIGGLGGSFLSQQVEMDEPVRDAIGGVIGEGAGALLGRFTPADKRRVNHDLQAAFRDAFCEGLYDIGGQACFPDQWQGDGRDVPHEVEFWRSAGRDLWLRGDPLADQVGQFLRELVLAVSEERLLPFYSPQPAANVERYLNRSTPQELSDEFFRVLLVPYLEQSRALFMEVRAFGPHLRRYLFDRTLLHLGEHLKQRSEAWRAFNRMVLEELRFTIRQLGADRALLQARLTVLGADQEQIRLQLGQVGMQLEYLIDHQVAALSDRLSVLLTVTGSIEKRVGDGFEALTTLIVSQDERVRSSFERTGRDIQGLPEQIRKVVQEELAKMASLSVPTRCSLPPAPKPPRQLVKRADEFERLFELLVGQNEGQNEGQNQRQNQVVALSGGAGFGKTTLAQAFCDDERVKEAFADGILWVTIGETPNVVELLSSVIQSLAPGESSYSDLNAASARLSALLQAFDQKPLLLVLDDVWRESDAKPFVDAHKPLLMTTRLQDVDQWSLPCAVQVVYVGEMTTDQATSLLINWLRPLPRLFLQAEGKKSLQALAQRLGEWPLLLQLVGAQLRDYVLHHQKSLFEALEMVHKRLEKRGLRAFNRANERARNRAIHISFELSLQQLDVHCGTLLNERQSWRKRYLELAIFPEDMDIPLAVICKLWQETAGFDEWESEEALFAMQRLSLFTRYDANAQTVRLHDVIRSLLASFCDDLPALHGQLLTSYAPVPNGRVANAARWAQLPTNEPYMWQNLAYHLHGARRWDELRALCLSSSWMQAKLNVTHVNGLLADYEWLAEDEASVQRVGQALRHAAHILSSDSGYLAGQLVARLMADEREGIQGLVREARQARRPPCLRPLRASLEQKDKYQRTFADHISGVNAVSMVSMEGMEGFGVSASSDSTLKVWDIASGRERLTLRGHTNRVAAVTINDGLVISADWDGVIKVWDILDGQLLREWLAHEDKIHEVVARDGMVISASDDKTIKLWDLTSGQLRSSWQIHDDGVISVAVDERVGVSASWDETLLVWDMGSGLKATLDGHNDLVASVVICQGRAISASHDTTLKIWDLERATCIRTLRGHTKEINAVAANQEIAVSASADKTLKVWQISSGRCLTTFHLDEELRACHLVDGTVMAGGESGRVHLLRLETE